MEGNKRTSLFEYPFHGFAPPFCADTRGGFPPRRTGQSIVFFNLGHLFLWVADTPRIPQPSFSWFGEWCSLKGFPAAPGPPNKPPQNQAKRHSFQWLFSIADTCRGYPHNLSLNSGQAPESCKTHRFACADSTRR